MKNNKDVVKDIRLTMLLLLKEVMSLEDKYYVTKPDEIGQNTYDYLVEVQRTLRKFDYVIEDIYRNSMRDKFSE